jgi:diguanylate cyclase (GGDEF)-like protein
MQLLGWVGAGLVVVVCAGLWMALRIARRVTGAVDGLNDAALALGAGRPVRLPRTQLVEADAVGAAILQASDILDHARHLAYHDALTGLCNRALFDEMLRRHVAASERHGTPLAVLLLDLDGFKSVNDRHGHAMGDAVLKSAAARIIGAVRAEDVAARLGGDEFGVLLFEADATQARLTAERMVALLSEPYAGADTPISASVGIAVWPHAGRTPAALLAGADRALYEAKRGGKRRASVAR